MTVLKATFFKAAIVGSVVAMLLAPQLPVGATPRDRVLKRLKSWPMPESTPEAQGIDPERLARAYANAAEIDHIYSMLVVKNGYLVAEQYFNGRNCNSSAPVASVTKSIVSVLVGIALNEGYLSDLDQPMIDFFPQYNTPHLDPRKRLITVRHLLQMRAGYPTDNVESFYRRLFASGDWMRFIVVDYELAAVPGTAWAYSSASAHLLAGILTRATGMSLSAYAQERLFAKIGSSSWYWPRDPQGVCIGYGDSLHTPRQLACFGQMVLNGGALADRRVLPGEWLVQSLQDYSATSYGTMGPYHDIRYGYLWWHAQVDGHDVYFAWGHGGQFITIVPTLELVVVTTAYNFAGDFTENSWETEGAIFYLIAEHVIPAAY